MKKQRIFFLTQAAMIAALYVVLTLLANVFGLASGVIQIRLSEILAVLPYFTPAAIPGVFLGCLLANLLTGSCLLDILAGSLASLLGVSFAYLLRKRKWLVPLPTIAANSLIVPFVLIYGYGVPDVWWYLVLTVGVGEVLSCGVLGMGLLFSLQKYAARIFRAAQ